jgi:hypothetical protein
MDNAPASLHLQPRQQNFSSAFKGWKKLAKELIIASLAGVRLGGRVADRRDGTYRGAAKQS